MTQERVLVLAYRAAELLPEPPVAHDPFGYLAWEELVVSTARRLQWLLDGDVGSPSSSTAVVMLAPGTGRLDGQALLTLAGLLAASDDSSACEGALSGAVAECRGELALPARSAAVTTCPHAQHPQHGYHRRSRLERTRRPVHRGLALHRV